MSTDNSSEMWDDKPLLALIAGPTASGKSDLAVLLALHLRERGREAVVINADSAQVYRDLSILSARPTAEDMRGVEHRLFGAWDGAQACSAADWARAARSEIDACHAAGRFPILVGGTGLYMRTLLEGIAPIPPIASDIRRKVRALSVEEGYAALTREDPGRAARLSPADTTRVARALEVVRSTGQSLDRWQMRREGGINDRIALSAVVLIPDRAKLYTRCDARFAGMIEGGGVAEVQALLARRLDPDLPVMRAIGVPEVTAFLRGDMTMDTMLERGAQATRNYAKRQFTWFRRQPPPDWFRLEYEHFDMKAIIEILLREGWLT